MSEKKETITEEIEIPQETITEITSTVVDAVKGLLDERDAKIDEKIAASQTQKTIESTPQVKKDIHGGDNPQEDTVKSFSTPRVSKDWENARKELKFMRHAKALASNNSDTVKHMNDYNIEKIGEYEDRIEEIRAEKGITGRYLSKATYNNETTDSEGRYLIPDPEFLIAIERYEAQYGVAFAHASVRTTDRTSVKSNKGITNVELYELDEAAAKTQTKPTYDQVSATMRKWAAIVVASDEFIDDQAANYWDDVTQGFARARAKKADEIVFTEDNTTNAKKGILNYPGTIVETVGSAATSITWDDLLNAETAVLPEGQINAKFVMHRTLWNSLIQKKGTTNDHYLGGLAQLGLKNTPWGTPVVISELFRNVNAGENNQPYALYGDLSKLQLWVNGGLQLMYSREGTVGSLKLYEQDLTALRAVTRMTKLITFPERFVVIGTGTVS